jgi:CDP-4-dehydro-6-deoxyglucose reductase/terephthalate 1,2-dioxygenase reductase component
MPAFTFTAALEDAGDARDLAGFHGRVDDAVRSLFPGLQGHEVYCCGSPAMVAAVRRACADEFGLDTRHFFSDAFVPGPAAI